jgi:hypothetical protein
MECKEPKEYSRLWKVLEENQRVDLLTGKEQQILNSKVWGTILKMGISK